MYSATYTGHISKFVSKNYKPSLVLNRHNGRQIYIGLYKCMYMTSPERSSYNKYVIILMLGLATYIALP